jgi:hypothetical protein
MEYKLPKKSTDLRIRHFQHMATFDDEAAALMFHPDEKISLFARADFIADFLGISRKKSYTYDKESIIDISSHLIDLYSSIHIGNPPKDITLAGKEYELINPEKVGVGWHADFSKMDINRDPVQLACMFYFPKGQIYGDVDENDNLLNPIRDRYNDIGDHMELKVFLEACAFFLRKTERSMRLSMARRTAAEKVTKILSRIGMHGRRSLISSQRNTTEEIGTKQ